MSTPDLVPSYVVAFDPRETVRELVRAGREVPERTYLKSKTGGRGPCEQAFSTTDKNEANWLASRFGGLRLDWLLPDAAIRESRESAPRISIVSGGEQQRAIRSGTSSPALSLSPDEAAAASDANEGISAAAVGGAA